VSEPRERLDLRLLPTAVASWCAALWITGGRSAPTCVTVTAALLLLLLVALAARRRLGAVGGGLVLALVAVVVVLASGWAHAAATARGGLTSLVEERAVVTATGVLRSDAVAAPSPWDPSAVRSRVVMAVTVVHARGTTRQSGALVQVTVPGAPTGLVRGASVRVLGRLSASELPAAGVAGTISAGSVEVLRPATGIDAWVARLRSGLLEVSDGLEPQARGLVPGMTLGDTSRLPAEVASEMRTVGLTHLTAVSGTHVAVVVLVVGSLAVRLRAPRAVRAVAAGLAIGGFVLLVHPEPSVLRAALMGVVGTAGLLLGRRSWALPALLATVVVLLAADPGLVRSIGFTLSVVATAAIVLLAVPADGLLPRVPRPIVHAVAVPLAAQSACGPLLIVLQPALSLWAVPANLAAAPAVLPATVLGLLATLCRPLSAEAAVVLARGSGIATGWIATVAHLGAGLPGSRLAWTPGAPGAVGLGALTALAWLLAVRVIRGARARAQDDGPLAGSRRRRARSSSSPPARGRLDPCPPPRVDRPRPP